MGNPTFTFRTIIYGTQENGLLGFRHNGTYGKFALNNLDILPASPINAATAMGKRQISRITGIVGGVDIPYVKSNSASASLPSQVKIVRRPEQVTLAGTYNFRSLLPEPLSLATLTLRSWGSKNALSTGTFWDAGDSNIQRMRLRQGQGVALTSDSVDPCYPFTMALTAIVKNQSSGATYIINSQHHPSEMSGGALAIFNGSGSGIDLELISLKVSDIGDPVYTTNPSMLRFLRIHKLVGGKDIVPIPSNSQKLAPNFLVVKRNFLSDDMGVMYQSDVTGGPSLVEFGYPSTNAPLVYRIGCFGRRVMSNAYIANPGLALSFWNPAVWSKRNVSGMDFNGTHGHAQHIMCGPGEGFAVVQSFNTCYAEYYVEMTIEWIPDADTKAPIVGPYLIGSIAQ